MKNSSDQAEKFDSLRAGLRIEDVDFKDAYTPKMIDQQNAYWRRIVDVLDDDVENNRALCNQLRIRRRQVLSGQYAPRSSPGMPRFAVGAAMGVALVTAVTVWWSPASDEIGQPVTRTASLETSEAGAGMTQTVSLEPGGVNQADFANNVDFYTWLKDQSDAVADAGDG